jgi:hypothetical protein
MKIWVAGDCLILKSDDLNFPKQSYLDREE